MIDNIEVENTGVNDWIQYFIAMITYYYLRTGNPILEKIVNDFLHGINTGIPNTICNLWNLGYIDNYHHLKYYIHSYRMSDFILEGRYLSELSLGDGFDLTISLLQNIIVKSHKKPNQDVITYLEKLISNLSEYHQNYLLSQPISKNKILSTNLYQPKVVQSNIDLFIEASVDLKGMADSGSTVCKTLLHQKKINKFSILTEIYKLGVTTIIENNKLDQVFLQLAEMSKEIGYTHIWILLTMCSQAIIDETK